MNVLEMLFLVQLWLFFIEYDGEFFCLVSVKNLFYVNWYKKLFCFIMEVSQVGGWEWDLVIDWIMLIEGVYVLLCIFNKYMDKEQWIVLLEDWFLLEDYKVFDFNIWIVIEIGEFCCFDL